MLFNSFQFAAFFIVVYALYSVMGRIMQNRMLLIGSYIFYASWDWRFLSLILISTIVDFYCGKRMQNSDSKRPFLALSLVTNLGLLGFFKYFNFFSENLQQLVTSFGIELSPLTLQVVLPVGISFYTFQTLSYTIDIYRGKLQAEDNFFDFALFVAFFPQLVAGPIERALSLLPQIKSDRTITLDDLKAGLWLIYWGLFLKIFVADNLGVIVDEIFSRPDADALSTIVASYAFAFQIFGDFAGYSSIAIGIARLMGFRLMTNFRCPYFITNPRDFWQHWHISLSTWLRDYLYIPLGGNRGSKWFNFRNLCITMLLGGLWHGAAWTFIVWGAFHGAILVIHRIYTDHEPSNNTRRSVYIVKAFLMFQVTCVGWLIFRSQSLEQLNSMLMSLLTGWSPSPQIFYYFLFLAFHTWLMLVLQRLEWRSNDSLAILKLPGSLQLVIYFLMFYSIVIFGHHRGTEFIYFQF